jgi:predicted  nucleic acid-binding Zn-ribbon protein
MSDCYCVYRKLDDITDQLAEFNSAALKRHRQVLTKLGAIVATLQEAVDGWRAYTEELKAQRDAAVAALEEASTRADTAAEALAQFQADDAATDAQQLADQAQADADFVSSELDKVKTPVEEPPVISEPVEEQPPVEEPPVEQPPFEEPPVEDVPVGEPSVEENP